MNAARRLRTIRMAVEIKLDACHDEAGSVFCMIAASRVARLFNDIAAHGTEPRIEARIDATPGMVDEWLRDDASPF